MNESLEFYTNVLDFTVKYPGTTADEPVVTIINDEAEIQLSTMPGDSLFGCAVNISVDNVDALFKKYLDRGLETSRKKNSPVHQGPVDQTWGMREFYVDDPNGNTLRFIQEIE
jgi:uncharacterized glyoxalase superfamily protein PhnB